MACLQVQLLTSLIFQCQASKRDTLLCGAHCLFWFITLTLFPPPSVNYYFGNSQTCACFICGTQPDLLCQAHQPSYMLLSLLAEPTYDTFVRFRGLRCVHSHQVVVLVTQAHDKSIEWLHRIRFKMQLSYFVRETLFY